MITIKNVLVATDFSEPSAAALEYGRALARTFGASLHVLHVVDNVLIPGAFPDAIPLYVPELLKDMIAVGQQHLDAVIREDDRRELDATGVVLTCNGTARGITEHAADMKADVIVIGTHGRSGWSHLMMGSIAEKVVRTAPCPVLTVHHPEREFVGPDAIPSARTPRAVGTSR